MDLEEISILKLPFFLMMEHFKLNFSVKVLTKRFTSSNAKDSVHRFHSNNRHRKSNNKAPQVLINHLCLRELLFYFQHKIDLEVR